MNKEQLTITGYSDDIISLDGSIYDEFSPSAADDTAIIKLPDNTEIKVFYDKDGLWRTEVLTKSEYNITIESGSVEEDTNDVLTVHSPIEYITWTSAGEKNAIGNIELTDEQMKAFNDLKSVLKKHLDIYGFDEAETAVKAILAGKF